MTLGELAAWTGAATLLAWLVTLAMLVTTRDRLPRPELAPPAERDEPEEKGRTAA
jgi:hypothetical protein